MDPSPEPHSFCKSPQEDRLASLPLSSAQTPPGSRRLSLGRRGFHACAGHPSPFEPEAVPSLRSQVTLFAKYQVSNICAVMRKPVLQIPPRPGCMALDKSRHLSVPQFPDL